MDIKHIENSHHGVIYEIITLRREINILTTDVGYWKKQHERTLEREKKLQSELALPESNTLNTSFMQRKQKNHTPKTNLKWKLIPETAAGKKGLLVILSRMGWISFTQRHEGHKANRIS